MFMAHSMGVLRKLCLRLKAQSPVCFYSDPQERLEWFSWGLPNFPITAHIRGNVKKPEENFIKQLSERKITNFKCIASYDHDMVSRLNVQ